MKRAKIFSAICALLLFSCNKQPVGNIDPGTSSLPRALASTWETLSDGSSFTDYTNFEAHWNYLYPWGSDHNGTARIYGSSTDHSQIYLNGDGSLTLKATPHPDSAPSTSPPYLPIHYHSGAVYSKHQVLVDATYPYWEFSGDFKAPTTFGTWPAFWCTGANSWPPESDFLEVKGKTSIWQNTYDGGWETKLTTVSDAATTWHHYKGVFNRLKNANGTWSNDVECQYFIDGVITSVQTGSNFVNQPMNIIIDFQMEAASGSPGPTGDTYFYAKNITIRRGKSPFDPNSWYKLVNRNSGQVLTVPSASRTPGTNLIQWPWLGGNEQQWQIGDGGNGYFILANRNSTQVADVKGVSRIQGAPVIQYPFKGGDNQFWQISPIGGGYYTFTNRNSTMVLDVSGALKTQGDTLIQYPYRSGLNQQWQIIRL